MARPVKHFIFLNEFTLLRAVILTLSNRSVYLMPSKPVFGFFSKLFVWIARSMERRSNVHDVFFEFNDSYRYWSIPGYSNRTDIFVKLENQINRRFKFDQVDQRLGAYAMSYKIDTCKYISERLNAVFLIRDLSQKYNAGEATIIFTNDDLQFAYEKYYGEPPRPCLLRIKQFRPVVNFGLLVAILLFSLAWAFSRLRWRKHDRRSFFLGADFISGPAHVRIVRDIIGDPEQCLFVFRNAMQRKNNFAEIDGYNQCINDNGAIAISELGSIINLIVKDTLKLYFHSPHLAPAHMLQILKLPYKKATYRALLNRFRFKYFWCRDDYNSGHTLRSQELRRVGSISLGINHGLPTPEIINPSWRYIDFDIYYVFGRHLYEKYYVDTWSKNMTVKPVGSMRMTRDHFNRRHDPRPDNIIYYVSPVAHGVKMHEAIRDVAYAFPEKRVFVKIKRGRKNMVDYDVLKDIIDNGPGNIIESDEDSYELMFNARYAVSGVSTITAEAIQFGLSAFSFDFEDADSPFYYRDFPGICVKSSADVIDRISAIDQGRESYPRDSYGGLIDLSERFIIDVIRDDIGLSSTASASTASARKYNDPASRRIVDAIIPDL